MPKNILIFSDGTGQAGGLMPDETRSNVYKFYRATRCGPDTRIDPLQQLAFYDPGLGSKADNGKIKFSLNRGIYNFLAQMTGLGITRNIIDCYAEIIRLWQPGDRIFLFGFSRGAYTARCIAGVLDYCGVPTTNGGKPLKLDPASVRQIASEAVKNVYQFGSSVKNDPYKEQRENLAAAFRKKYGSSNGNVANAAPYFIGVWDTVSTLGLGRVMLSILGGVVFALLTAAVKYAVPFMPDHLTWLMSAAIAAGLAAVVYAAASVRYRRSLSLAKFRMAFYDTHLSPTVGYARHALSIDENRKDFPRVIWNTNRLDVQVKSEGPDRFKQVWFAGVHSNVGGGYAENESRLSDISLKWMLDEARSLPHPILADDAYLRLAPSSGGMQHDERKVMIARMWRWVRVLGCYFLGDDRLGWAKGVRMIDPNAPLHPSVIERFAMDGVLHYDEIAPYRPEALREHSEVKKHY